MRSKALFAWVVLVYAFLYLPILMMALFSFNRSANPYHWEGFSLTWYAALFRDEEVINAFVQSLWISLVSTFMAGVFGTLIAVGTRKKASKIIEPLLMLPVILPDIVLGISLLLLFVFVRLELGKISVIFSHVTFCMVYVYLVVRVRLHTLDPALEEAARDLGANAVQTFFKVTFPLVLPGIIAGSFLAFTLSFEDFLITFFTAGVGTTTLPLKIYSMMKYGVSPVISALSTLFIGLTIGAALVARKFNAT